MNEISIRIFWGQWGGEFNPSPIVSIGNMVDEFVPVAPDLVSEEQSWMIKLDEWKAVYACHSKERCTNSDNYLQLLICVVFPKSRLLADGKSPLDLLEALRRQFGQLFAFDLDAALPSREKVDTEFARLLKDYALVECPWYVFNMEGTDPASFCLESRSQLNALMRYNAYPLLAHIEHLELGFKCKSTVDINTKGESNQITKRNTSWWKSRKSRNKAKANAHTQESDVNAHDLIALQTNEINRKHSGNSKGQTTSDPETGLVREPSITSASNEKTSKKGWIWLVLAILLVGNFTTVFILMNGDNKDNLDDATKDDTVTVEVQTEHVLPVQNQYVFINAKELRLRKGPSLDTDMLRKPDGSERYATRNEKFLYKGESPDFYKVEYYDGREFWVARQYANCVMGEGNDWDTERHIRGFVSDFMMMAEMSSESSWSMVHQLFAPYVERYFGYRNETVEQVAQHIAKYDKTFGVNRKHSKVRWNTLEYANTGDRYSVKFIEDYTIDCDDTTKYSVFVLEKHIELNSDFKAVSVYDDELSRSKKDRTK